METKRTAWKWVVLLFILFSVGCAGVPVRDAVKVDLSVPAGKIEGHQFTGVRFPFKVAAPPGWQVAMNYPKFMLDLGYEKEGLQESEVFIFNPATQSNLQIDFTPAGRYSTFDQKTIEWLTTSATGGFQEELQKDYGKNIQVEISPTEPYSLKGVPFAAKKFARYTLKEMKREQGWIYAFSEPYQIFILYMILGQEEGDDRQGIQAILNSFEVIPKGSR
jgi:hypothetical protein